ncbi:hypothetical protein AAFC00_004707 [Neodothiora populina]|uniref:TeaA receptor TeaR n=1 Tax=Neodothiora populina TaxID=2781224 RepID=A0ABR3P322_9PEZI
MAATAAAYPSIPYGSATSNQWDQAVPGPDDNSFNYNYQPVFDHGTYAFSDNTLATMDDTRYDHSAPYDSSRSFRTQRSGNNMETLAQDSQQSKSSQPNAKHSLAPRKRSVGAGLKTDDVDDSAWIHRDKLAQIESREMAQAGISLAPAGRRRGSTAGNRSSSRSASRASNKRVHAQDAYSQHDALPSDPASYSTHQEQSRRDESASGRQDREQYQSDDTMDYDPAMLMQEYSQAKPQHQYNRSLNASLNRPNTSRIPIAKASPAPVSSSVVSRDSPLTRTRQGSNPWPSNTAESPYQQQQRRSRSQSLGSSIMMDEASSPRNSATARTRPRSSHFQPSPRTSVAGRDTPSDSSSKGKAPATAKQPASSVNGRKGTTNRNTTRSRTTSATRKTSPGSRPASSSATKAMNSVKRPEGDAPWIATMYKPDPRLPQDQQLLPTHAKRMMQEQWEKDGKTGSAYDKDFNLLNDHDLASMGAFPTPSPSAEQGLSTDDPQSPREPEPEPEPQAEPSQDSQSPWPLSSKKSDRSSLQPATPSGGYKITPTVPLPSPSQPSPMGVTTQISSTRPQSVQRVPDMDEKEDGKKEKGCGCCIMM